MIFWHLINGHIIIMAQYYIFWTCTKRKWIFMHLATFNLQILILFIWSTSIAFLLKLQIWMRLAIIASMRKTIRVGDHLYDIWRSKEILAMLLKAIFKMFFGIGAKLCTSPINCSQVKFKLVLKNVCQATSSLCIIVTHNINSKQNPNLNFMV